MQKPNFSESQLQQLVNTEITMYLDNKNKSRFSHPTIISLIEEYGLGWDTGFYFPWLDMTPNPDHRGCNFFIQYKLSNLIKGHSAHEWKDWNHPYLRFQIPYSTKDKKNNKSIDDYHQFDRLKELTDNGYFVYYATNHVIYDSDLFRIATNKNLINEIPFLDVSRINAHHKKVTFDEKCSHFLLHSEPEKIETIKWNNILENLTESKKTLLFEDINFLEKFIIDLEERLLGEVVGGYLDEIHKYDHRDEEFNIVLIKQLIISKYLRKYLGIFWFRY